MECAEDLHIFGSGRLGKMTWCLFATPYADVQLVRVPMAMNVLRERGVWQLYYINLKIYTHLYTHIYIQAAQHPPSITKYQENSKIMSFNPQTHISISPARKIHSPKLSSSFCPIPISHYEEYQSISCSKSAESVSPSSRLTSLIWYIQGSCHILHSVLRDQHPLEYIFTLKTDADIPISSLHPGSDSV